MFSDFCYVLRSQQRNRGFTFVTVLTLALGIGSGGAIFSATDWLLFRRSQLPKEVYMLGGQRDQQAFTPARFDFMVRAYQETRGALGALELASNCAGNVVVENQPVDTNWLAISPGLFPLLGITPLRGRAFAPGDDVPGADQVVIVSYKFWMEHLGGSEEALGKKIRVGDEVCVVIGILKEDQEYPPFLYRGVYRPLIFRTDPKQPWAQLFFCFTRPAPGVTREQVQAELRAAKVDVPAQMQYFVGSDKVVVAGLTELLHQFAPTDLYRLLVGAVGCLYAIACLNASNLMLVRMLGMRRELGIRLALGGGRLHIVRLLALESTTLAVGSAVLGLLVANWVFPMLLTSLGGTDLASRSWTEWTLGWRVIGVMAGLTALTGLVISIIPAIRVLHTDINAGLKEGGMALGESRALARLRGAIVVLQAAFAVILLAGAGLMIRTFENFQKVNLGFEPKGLIKLQLSLPPRGANGMNREAQLAQLHELQEVLERAPGATAVGFGEDIILPGYYFSSNIELEAPGGKTVKIGMAGLSPGFQRVTGIKLTHGRWPDQANGNEVLINETLARILWPGIDNPVGRFVRTIIPGSHPGKDWKGSQIVGVVADIRDRLREAPGSYVYMGEGWSPDSLRTFFVRLGCGFNPTVADDLRRRIYGYDSQIVVQRIVSVDEDRNEQLWAENKANSVLRVLAAIALLLAVVGVFAVLAYSVDLRMNEFGVRMALGAMPGDLVRLVMGRGVALMLVGLALGLGGALVLTRFLQSLLFETSALDPWVLGGVAGVLLTAAVLACLWPARRAASVDVSKLLRSE